MNEQEFLYQLLSHPLPSATRFSPVTLRSVEEQRRVAFEPRLQRTWVDRALHTLERVMTLLAIGFFACWAIDGYGYDWLHQFHRRSEGKTTGEQTSRASSTALLSPPSRTMAGHPAVALPFTTPDMGPEREQESYLVPQTISIPPEPHDRRPFRLQIPAIQLDAPVVEVFLVHGAWQVANYAVGYHHGSALPGEVGNVVMAGHAGLRGAVFRHLDRLQPGDMLMVDAGAWRYEYLVRNSLRVWPTQVEVMAQSVTPILTLITCTDWDTRRLVVVADLVNAYPLPEYQTE